MPSITLEPMTTEGILVLTFSDEFIIPDDLKRLKAEELKIEGRKRSNLELSITPVGV